MPVINQEITIPDNELAFSYARSSGPGGQNVNKVNSKVILKWNVHQSAALPPGVKNRFLNRYGNRLSQDGALTLNSDESRDRPVNQRRCLEKLRAMILAVYLPPRKRRPTKPTRASREKRLKEKKARGERKQNRGRVDY